jgi:hypothetical protein
MSKWTTLVWTGLACCLAVPALSLAGGADGRDMGCLPPPLVQDYVKKTVRVEIKGQLKHIVIREPIEWPLERRDGKYPMPKIFFMDSWQVSAGDKTYTVDFGERKDVTDLANKLDGKTVIVNGTLDNGTVHVTGLKADEEYVKQTTEVELRGRLKGVRLKFRDIGFPEPNDVVDFLAWNVTVGDKTYSLNFATPELEKLAEALDGQAILLTGELSNDTITVKTLTAAPL